MSAQQVLGGLRVNRARVNGKRRDGVWCVMLKMKILILNVHARFSFDSSPSRPFQCMFMYVWVCACVCLSKQTTNSTQIFTHIFIFIHRCSHNIAFEDFVESAKFTIQIEEIIGPLWETHSNSERDSKWKRSEERENASVRLMKIEQ